MARLKFLTATPPRGWIYVQPETRLRIKGDNLPELVGRTIQHRQQQRLQPQDRTAVQLDIERQICARLGTEWCRPEGPDDPWVPRRENLTIGLGDIMGASKGGLEWLEGGRQLVSLDENQRRREVCAACPLNVPARGCLCAPLYKAIAKVVPGERRFPDLHVCQACRCSLQVKCAVPAEVIVAADAGRGISYPVQCWVPALLPT